MIFTDSTNLKHVTSWPPRKEKKRQCITNLQPHNEIPKREPRALQSQLPPPWKKPIQRGASRRKRDKPLSDSRPEKPITPLCDLKSALPHEFQIHRGRARAEKKVAGWEYIRTRLQCAIRAPKKRGVIKRHVRTLGLDLFRACSTRWDALLVDWDFFFRFYAGWLWHLALFAPGWDFAFIYWHGSLCWIRSYSFCLGSRICCTSPE